jgi:hypothetical protein
MDGICFAVSTVIFSLGIGFVLFFIGEQLNWTLPPMMTYLVSITLGAFCAYEVLK